MTTIVCANPSCPRRGNPFQAKTVRKKFCSHSCQMQAHRREKDPLIGSAAREARKQAGLEKKKRGKLRQHIRWDMDNPTSVSDRPYWRPTGRIAAGGRMLGHDRLLGFDQGNPYSFQDDRTSFFDAQWKRKQAAKRKQSEPDNDGTDLAGAPPPAVGSDAMPRDAGAASYCSRTDGLNNSAEAYLRALHSQRRDFYPELAVALKHEAMANDVRSVLVGFFEGKTSFQDATLAMHQLDAALNRLVGDKQSASEWLEAKRYVLDLYRAHDMKGQAVTTDVLNEVRELRAENARRELLEQMHRETLDAIRADVARLVDVFQDDERIQEASRYFLEDDSA